MGQKTVWICFLGVFLFYGSLSGEYIAEILPDNPPIIDMFKLD